MKNRGNMGFKKIAQLVGGDWNHGIDYDFPLGMECHHPN